MDSLLKIDHSHYDRLKAIGFDDHSYITREKFPKWMKLVPVVAVIKWMSEKKGLHTAIHPEFYVNGINWLWQVFWYKPKEEWEGLVKGNEEWEEMSMDKRIKIYTGTAMYGDNGEYPTMQDAQRMAMIWCMDYLEGQFDEKPGYRIK